MYAAVGGDDGSAALEFVIVGLLLLVPLAYLMLALGLVQHRILGAESAARHVARVVATAEDSADAGQRAERVMRAIATEYGLDPADTRLALECRPAASVCPAAGATISVTVKTTVALPFVPPLFGLDRIARIGVEEVAVQRVSRYGTGS